MKPIIGVTPAGLTATRRMLRALSEYRIEPLITLIPFHQAVLASDDWAEASTLRDKIGDKKWLKALAPETPPTPTDEDPEPTIERTYQVEVNGRLHSVKVIGAGAPAAGAGQAAAKRPPRRERSSGGGSSASGPELLSPLQGTVFKVAVEQGQEVAEGDLVMVIEAMKMENEIAAPRDGIVTELGIGLGQGITSGQLICVVAATG